MRIIKRSTLAAYAQRNPQAETGLLGWHELAKKARWTCLQDVRATFPHANAVTVASGRRVVVFNIAGNKYRLISVIKCRWQIVFIRHILTHAEYDEGKWKL